MIGRIKERLKEKIKNVDKKSDRRYYIEIAKADLHETALYFFRDLKFRLSIITGIDNVVNMELLYHFSDDNSGALYNLRVFLEREKPEIETITDITSASKWIEREIHELLGVEFRGNKDLRRLLLDTTWPQGVYPLRKDYPYGKRESFSDAVVCNLTKPLEEGRKIITHDTAYEILA